MEGLRWGVLGTAGIARSRFLPALREAGGRAVLVGGRDGIRASAWAAEHGVERGTPGYAAVLEDDSVEAVYIALPNTLHAEWAERALAAGKAVLCEKPLSTSESSAAAVVAAADRAGGLLWEAFVFPFQAQHARVLALLADGAIGELREIVGSFHFALRSSENIRLREDVFGGAVADVGCYPLRLAHELFDGTEPTLVGATAVRGAEVEVEVAATLGYRDDRRLLLTCGFRRAMDTSALLLGTEGVIAIDDPYHPKPSSRIEVRVPGREPVVERPTRDEHTFTAALRHITRAVRGDEAPRQLAHGSAVAVARAVDEVRGAIAR